MDILRKSSLVLLTVFIVGMIYIVGTYNSLVSQQQGVKAAWSQVENTYQRRADLIPNLVKTVKGYAAHEKETFIQVINARNSAIKTQQAISMEGLPSAAQLRQIEAGQQNLSAALGRLLVVVERYPDLKASQNFLALQAELAGTENRIAVERRRFNLAAQAYNTNILKFPQRAVANYFDFKPTAYFTAQPHAETVPQVDF